jgi:hypothetical protein
MKKPREKFRVERVERDIPRVRREKVFMSLESVLSGVKRGVWTFRRISGRAISTRRIATVRTCNELAHLLPGGGYREEFGGCFLDPVKADEDQEPGGIKN